MVTTDPHIHADGTIVYDDLTLPAAVRRITYSARAGGPGVSFVHFLSCGHREFRDKRIPARRFMACRPCSARLVDFR